MYRALATVALFKLFIALVIFFTSSTLDPVLLVSSLLVAISALIIRIVEEGEVAFVLVGLILFIDVIGLLLSLASYILKTSVAYAFLVVWDVQTLLLFRRVLQM
ncbi:hypothetical protein Pogu_0143 [Pyrobaculum oguniense TE7]|uniref:Uncharacterized protein n=1 Tax=Pyrobaculum oguniense (strain DSM 13380 / JCM 10595 / TE7) TaxID=698757 RepID=H6Q667_PYROT|nr:hypothetical protein Pogu_0143 [Pyrobaculum oguniense TE7]